MELQFKYPGLWLVKANLNNGISTQISLILRIKTNSNNIITIQISRDGVERCGTRSYEY